VSNGNYTDLLKDQDGFSEVITYRYVRYLLFNMGVAKYPQSLASLRTNLSNARIIKESLNEYFGLPSMQIRPLFVVTSANNSEH